VIYIVFIKKHPIKTFASPKTSSRKTLGTMQSFYQYCLFSSELHSEYLKIQMCNKKEWNNILASG
jgi:hypothetical protein